ncbi:MAG: hypothetical protein AB7I98_03030 [Verrucomicrobiales bacterium]|nr:hypothetical protein [Verrucomicrobiae bacterium]
MNPYDAKKQDAIRACKEGRFEDALEPLEELLSLLSSHGAPTASSDTMYWFLVARHKGDEKKAMDEFMML